MRKRLLLIIAVIFTIGLISTNPSKQEYNEWMLQVMGQKIEGEFTKGLFQLVARPMIEISTKQKDYMIFSIYETNIYGEKVKTIGVTNRFIPISHINNKKKE